MLYEGPILATEWAFWKTVLLLGCSPATTLWATDDPALGGPIVEEDTRLLLGT